MGATRAEMHIDIYFIILFQIATLLLVYQMAMPINRISDETIKLELKKLRSDYDGAISLGDIVVWPIIITVIFPIYILVRLVFKRMVLSLFKAILCDKQLILFFVGTFSVFLLLVTFALFHWFVAYAIVFTLSVIHFIFSYKKEKARYEA